MSSNFLILGKTGQLARALAHQTRLSGTNAKFLDRDACDLSGSAESILAILKTQPNPDILIIAAAYTAVDQAESEPETAFAVNGQACATIARYCYELGIPLVHVSTDYVFDGKNAVPYLVDHQTAPLGIYGASKLAGETSILGSGCRAVILRTSWVFDGLGKNFLTTMLRLAATRDILHVVDDQIGRPTYAGHLAQAVLTAAHALVQNAHGSTGVFHVSGTGDPISWAGFASEIFNQSSEFGQALNIQGIPTSEYPTPAARPQYSVLDNSAYEKAFGYTLPHWKEGLREALTEREAQASN